MHMDYPWAWPSPELCLSQGFSRGGVGTSRVRLLPTGTRDMALKPPFSFPYFCSKVPGPKASYCVVPSTVFPTRGYRGMAVSAPESGDAHSWRRPHLATPTPGNAHTWRRPKQSTLTFLLGAPLGGSRHTFDFDFDFGQGSGTGRYTSPPVLS